MVVLSNLIKGPFLNCEVKNEGIIALDWHEILKLVLRMPFNGISKKKWKKV